MNLLVDLLIGFVGMALGQMAEINEPPLPAPTPTFTNPLGDIRAVIPTATGEIGINLVDLITAHSDYYLVVEGATKWRGGVDHLMQTTTQTSGGTTIVVTKSIQVAVHTATAAANGIEPGDLSIVLSPAARTALERIFATVRIVCPVLRLRARQPSAVGLCIIKQLETQIASSEITSGLVGSGLEISKDAGAANLIRYVLGEVVVAGLEGLAGLVMESLSLLAKAEGVPVFLGAVTMMFSVWLVAKTMPNGINIPKKVIKEKLASPTVVAPTTTTSSRITSYVRAQAMTDYYQPFETPFDTALADALATALANRFDADESKIVRPTPCIKQVLRNCMIVLEFDEVPGGPKPCPELPDRPPECPNGYEGIGNPTIAPIPFPTAEIVVAWERPMKISEKTKYAIYEQAYNLKETLYEGCGGRKRDPSFEITDPGDLSSEGERLAAFAPRTLPIELKLGDISGRKNCVIKQDTVDMGMAYCAGGFEFNCLKPSREWEQTLSANFGYPTSCQRTDGVHVEVPLICSFSDVIL